LRGSKVLSALGFLKCTYELGSWFWKFVFFDRVVCDRLKLCIWENFLGFICFASLPLSLSLSLSLSHLFGFG